jgi:hypothetical protein
MSLYEFDKLPTTSGQAIVEFNDRYLAAQGVALPPNWAAEFGDVGPTNSPKVTYPISQLSGSYQETKGDSRYKTAREASFDVKVIEFDMGYEAKLIDLLQSVFAYRKWLQAAQRYTVAEQVHIAKSVAALVEAGESTLLSWEGSGIYFFDPAHPANFAEPSLGTFSNYQSNAKDPNSIANIMAECTAMEGAVLDETGEKLGVSPDTIMLPTAKFRIVDALLKQQNVSVSSGTGVPGGGTATMSNPLAGLRAVHCPQLTDVNDWYLLDSKLIASLPPWAALRYSPGPALELRTFDESSDFFKATGRLKQSSHIWYGFGLVFPHAIRKIVGA